MWPSVSHGILWLATSHDKHKRAAATAGAGKRMRVRDLPECSVANSGDFTSGLLQLRVSLGSNQVLRAASVLYAPTFQARSAAKLG